jgi:hypothetical protein
MTRRHALGSVGLLLALAGTAAALPGFVGIENGPDVRPYGQQTHAFRAVLKQVGLKPYRAPFRQPPSDPAGRVVIMLGQVDGSEAARDAMRTYLDKGGALLIATDRPLPPLIKELLGVEISDKFVRVPPEYGWNGMEDCPLLKPLPWTGGPVLDHVFRRGTAARNPLFAGLADGPGVATNKPSFIGQTIRPLAAGVVNPFGGINEFVTSQRGQYPFAFWSWLTTASSSTT